MADCASWGNFIDMIRLSAMGNAPQMISNQIVVIFASYCSSV